MVASAVNWENVLSGNKVTGIDLGTTLADNTLSAEGAVITNDTGLDMLVWLELTTSDNSALFDTTPPGAGAAAVIYMVKQVDGTNYEDAPITGGAGCGGMLLATIPIRANTAGKRIAVGPFSIPPCKFKLHLDADWNAAATLTAEWELNIYTNNPENQ